MAQNPDIISFHTGIRNPHWYIDSAVMKQPEFDKFIDVGLDIEGSNGFDFVGTMWFNKYSKKVGVRKSGNQLSIPGYLFLPADTNDRAIYRKNRIVRPLKPGTEYTLSLKSDGYSYYNFAAVPKGMNVSYKSMGDSISYTVTNPNDTVVYLIDVVATKSE
jgi:hypothetical protein